MPQRIAAADKDLTTGPSTAAVHRTTANTKHVYLAGRSASVPVASARDSPACCAEDQQDDPDNDEDLAKNDGDLVEWHG